MASPWAAILSLALCLLAHLESANGHPNLWSPPSQSLLVGAAPEVSRVSAAATRLWADSSTGVPEGENPLSNAARLGNSHPLRGRLWDAPARKTSLPAQSHVGGSDRIPSSAQPSPSPEQRHASAARLWAKPRHEDFAEESPMLADAMRRDETKSWRLRARRDRLWGSTAPTAADASDLNRTMKVFSGDTNAGALKTDNSIFFRSPNTGSPNTSTRARRSLWTPLPSRADEKKEGTVTTPQFSAPLMATPNVSIAPGGAPLPQMVYGEAEVAASGAGTMPIGDAVVSSGNDNGAMATAASSVSFPLVTGDSEDPAIIATPGSLEMSASPEDNAMFPGSAAKDFGMPALPGPMTSQNAPTAVATVPDALSGEGGAILPVGSAATDVNRFLSNGADVTSLGGDATSPKVLGAQGDASAAGVAMESPELFTPNTAESVSSSVEQDMLPVKDKWDDGNLWISATTAPARANHSASSAIATLAPEVSGSGLAVHVTPAVAVTRPHLPVLAKKVPMHADAIPHGPMLPKVPVGTNGSVRARSAAPAAVRPHLPLPVEMLPAVPVAPKISELEEAEEVD